VREVVAAVESSVPDADVIGTLVVRISVVVPLPLETMSALLDDVIDVFSGTETVLPYESVAEAELVDVMFPLLSTTTASGVVVTPAVSVVSRCEAHAPVNRIDAIPAAARMPFGAFISIPPNPFVGGYRR
jgi:hypothetical protein